MNLLKRRPDQFFFVVDNDVLVVTKDWISKYMAVFKTFPEVGLLGSRAANEYFPPVLLKKKGDISYQELIGNASNIEKNYIPAHCMCLRPELIEKTGYFCEENCFGGMELTYRVCNYTDYKAGFIPAVIIQMPQSISCSQCTYAKNCKLNKVTETCISKYTKLNKNEEFMKNYKWKFDETMRDMKSGDRPVYCASLLDSVSMKTHVYNMDWALNNFLFYIQNAN